MQSNTIEMIKEQHKIDNVVPCVYQGNVLEDYYIDNAGQIYSTKVWPFGEKMTYSYDESKRYPRVKLQDYSSGLRKPRGVAVHRIVAETFIPFLKPAEISQEDWDNTPQNIKDYIFKEMQINHLDSNRMNYHPSNLEWSSSTENRIHYQEKIRLKIYKKPVFNNPNKPQPGASLESFFEEAA